MEEQVTNTAPEKTPLLLKIICYYIIIKTGMKILLCLVFLISGGHIEALKNSIGFDTIDNGGISLQLLLIALGGLHIFAATKMLQMQRYGLFMHLILVLVLFFAPAFFSPETYMYTPSRIGFMMPLLLLPAVYYNSMK